MMNAAALAAQFSPMRECLYRLFRQPFGFDSETGAAACAKTGKAHDGDVNKIVIGQRPDRHGRET
jgi:hypothetical protein